MKELMKELDTGDEAEADGRRIRVAVSRKSDTFEFVGADGQAVRGLAYSVTLTYGDGLRNQ